jgi:predicted transcriptional regulator
MKELTKAEEQVMQILWKIEKGFVKDILAEMPPPKPAYNTVSTITRILEKKGFAGHRDYGKSHQYYPLVSKKEYSKNSLKKLVQNYFSNSYENMVSFFAREESLSVEEMQEIRDIIDEEIQKNKKYDK